MIVDVVDVVDDVVVDVVDVDPLFKPRIYSCEWWQPV